MDFYDFAATSGKTLLVTSHSSLLYLATIQDYATGTVLASTSTCGFTQDSCSLTYSVPVSGTYVVGIGTVGTGSYSLTLTDSTPPPPPQSNCTATALNLCLAASRFKVSVAWLTGPAGGTPTGSGNGTAIPMTSNTGYFWFFDSSNVEVTVKVLDATGVNGKFWVFAAGMTNLQATITVTDTKTGAVKRYSNPQGVAFLPVQDTAAFIP